jgi:hypothetical protein
MFSESTSTAYLVVSHRAPDQVLRLVRALGEHPNADVVVRHDPRHAPLDPVALARAGGRPHEDGRDVEWGGWTYLLMLLGALERIAAELDPDWVIVLSGQDYPVRPLYEVRERLAAAEHDAFLGALWELETDAAPPPPAGDFFRRSPTAASCHRRRGRDSVCAARDSRSARPGAAGSRPTGRSWAGALSAPCCAPLATSAR